jgi:hypothetical protein
MKTLKSILASALVAASVLLPLAPKAQANDDHQYYASAQRGFMETNMQFSDCVELLNSIRRDLMVITDGRYGNNVNSYSLSDNVGITHCYLQDIIDTDNTSNRVFGDYLTIAVDAVHNSRDYDTALINFERAIRVSRNTTELGKATRGVYASTVAKSLKSGGSTSDIVYDTWRLVTGSLF